MGFFEFAIAFSVIVLLPILIVKMTLDYKRERMRSGLPEEGMQQTAVTVGELKELVRDIVKDTHADIEARLVDLEARIDASSPEDPNISDVPAERTVGRRTT